jgi:SAM-dependent methyltransferase
MPQDDLASPEHWTSRYEMQGRLVEPGWHPADYNSLVIERALFKAMARSKPQTIFEVGCGASTWLPYLAQKTGAAVAGIDYSELGCELARAHLQAEGMTGNIYCADIFTADVVEIGQYDFVFSLGVVEHFTDLAGILGAVARFVRPGGILFTEIPNLRSIHGVLGWMWQPKVLAQHVMHSKKDLVQAYLRLGLQDISAEYQGLFSLGIVAWGVEPRWPGLEKRLLPWIRKSVRASDGLLRKYGRFDTLIPFLSPFIFTVGLKPWAE